MQNEKHDDCDCICFFVLTHGKIGDNVSAYDMTYPVQMIWQPFNSDSCISLAGKPKLFFVQVKILQKSCEYLSLLQIICDIIMYNYLQILLFLFTRLLFLISISIVFFFIRLVEV